MANFGRAWARADFWLQVNPTSSSSEAGLLSGLVVLFDEVDNHFDETVQVHRNENPLQQFTQLTHGVAQGERPLGAKKSPDGFGAQKRKKPACKRAFGKFRTS